MASKGDFAYSLFGDHEAGTEGRDIFWNSDPIFRCYNL